MIIDSLRMWEGLKERERGAGRGEYSEWSFAAAFASGPSFKKKPLHAELGSAKVP